MPRTKEQSERLSRNLTALSDVVSKLMRDNNSGNRDHDLLEVADAIAAMLYTHLALTCRPPKSPFDVAAESLQRSATICELIMAMLGHKLGGGKVPPVQIGMAIGDVVAIIAAAWNDADDPRCAKELITGASLGAIKGVGKSLNYNLPKITDRTIDLAIKFAGEAIEIVNSAKPFDPENN